MNKVLQGFLLLALLCILSACSQEPPVDPTVTASVTAAQASLVQPEPMNTPPNRVLTDEQPALPYLHITHYVNGESVSGFIALTDEEVAQASRETAHVDVADAVEVCTSDNPQGSYGLMPPLYAELATRYAGFCAQSPADIGQIVSAAMTVTQLDETQTQTITSPADLARLETILHGAERLQRTSCPWNGVLVLTMADGSTMTIQKATDSCGTMLFGTAFCYQISAEDNAWLWSLFHEVAPNEAVSASLSPAPENAAFSLSVGGSPDSCSKFATLKFTA